MPEDATAVVGRTDAAANGRTDDALSSRLARLLRAREVGIFCGALALFILLSVLAPQFATPDNLFNVVRQISLLGIIAVGMTFVFISGELDLSVGSMYGLLAIVMAQLTINGGIDPFAAALAVIAMGAVLGLVNGTITTRFAIPSFIVTLGMLAVLRGAALLVSEGMPVSGLDAPAFETATSAYLFGIVPAQAVWLLLVVAVGAWVLTRTRFGYDVYATGGNAAAARHVGINVARVKTTSFVITGALVGLASAILIGWLRGTSPLTGQSFELDVIAAVIIGGTNLFGGAGSVIGTFLGAAIIGMISNGLVLLGVSAYWEPVVKGAVIIIAVLVSVTIRRRQGT